MVDVSRSSFIGSILNCIEDCSGRYHGNLTNVPEDQRRMQIHLSLGTQIHPSLGTVGNSIL
jgi:hypothetical protein